MDSKLFGLRPNLGMAKKDPRGKNSDIAIRLRAIMEAEHIGTQDAFAAKITTEKKRLNNPMVGYPLSIEISTKIKRAVPGMTRDWLYDGDVDGLPVSLRDRLLEAETKLRAELPRSGTKKRSTTSTARRSTVRAS
jgi:hypothetical protein